MKTALAERSFGPRLSATVVGLGCASLSGEEGGYGFGAMSEAEAQRVLECAYESGIRLYDTAPIYGFGESENRLGRFFRNHPAALADSVIVTKLGVDWDAQRKVRIDNSPETVRRMFKQSLERMGLSKIHVYMIHWPDAGMPIERTMEALVELKGEGLLDSIGLSNFSPEQIAAAECVAPVDVVQAPLSVLSASAKDVLLPQCGPVKARGFMSYATLAKGILSGSVSRDRTFEASDVRARGDKTHRQREAVDAHLQEFWSVAKNCGLTGTQLATAWVLSHEAVSTALCGCKNPEQIAEAVASSQVILDPAIKKRLDVLAASATVVFDSIQ